MTYIVNRRESQFINLLYKCLNCSREVDTVFLEDHSKICQSPTHPAHYIPSYISLQSLKNKFISSIRKLRLIYLSNSYKDIEENSLPNKNSIEKIELTIKHLESLLLKDSFEPKEINYIESNIIFSFYPITSYNKDLNSIYKPTTIPNINTTHHIEIHQLNSYCDYCVTTAKLLYKFHNINVNYICENF